MGKCLEVAHFYQNDNNKAKNIIKSLIDEGEWSPNLKSHFLNNLLDVQTSQVSELQNYLKNVRKKLFRELFIYCMILKLRLWILNIGLVMRRRNFWDMSFPLRSN